jgi:proteasome accessory factor C
VHDVVVDLGRDDVQAFLDRVEAEPGDDLVTRAAQVRLRQADLRSAREKVVDALGFDPIEEGLHIVSPKVDDDIMHRAETAIAEHRLMELEYWTQSQDRYSERIVAPYGRINSREGWYIAAWDQDRGRLIHFRLDRIKRARVLDQTFEPSADLDVAADIGGWPRTGRIGGSRSARVLVRAEQARWAREQRPVLTELEGDEVVVEITFKGLDFLVREVLKEAGDAVVLEPADARDAVLDAAEKLVARAT